MQTEQNILTRFKDNSIMTKTLLSKNFEREGFFVKFMRVC